MIIKTVLKLLFIVPSLLMFFAMRSMEQVPDINPLSTVYLFDAVWQDDLDSAKAMLSKRANVNARNQEGFTPLHIAIQSNNAKMVELLISYGANLNLRDRIAQEKLEGLGYSDVPWWRQLPLGSLTPLEYALLLFGSKADKAEAMKIIKVLIERGTDLNPEDVRLTPLHVAATASPRELIELLISYGAYVNIRNSRRVTPLHLSALYHLPENTTTLLRYGADANARDRSGYTPLAMILDLLEDGYTSTDVPYLIYLLLLFGTDISQLDEKLKKPLKTIISESPLFKDPIIQGLILNYENTGKVFALIFALTGQETEAIEQYFLMAIGRHSQLVPCIFDIYGIKLSEQAKQNAFLRASQLGHLDHVVYLYENLHPNYTLLNQAFHLASRSLRFNVMEFLLNTGHISLETTRKVLRLALMWQQFPLIEFLYVRGAIPPEDIHSMVIDAAGNGRILALSFFYNLTETSSKVWESALLKAAINGQSGAVRYLLSLPLRLNVDIVLKTITNMLSVHTPTPEQRAHYAEILELLNSYQSGLVIQLPQSFTSYISSIAE